MDELLAVVIAVTGVTVPLIIVYRASMLTEIRNTVATAIESFFSSKGMAVDDFMEAYTQALGDLQEQQRPANGVMAHDVPPVLQPEPILIALGRAYRARDRYDHINHVFMPFPEAPRTWLIGSDKTVNRHFVRIYDEQEDRPVSVWLLWVLSALVLICFSDLYAMHLGFLEQYKAWGWQSADRWLVIYTFVVNLLTYVVLGWFVTRRAFFEAKIEEEVWRLCPETLKEVKASRQRRESQADVDQKQLEPQLPVPNGTPKQ